VIPAELAKQIEKLGRELPVGLAVFDADGTLWREDVGEAFLRHLVSLGWVQLPDGSDPYEAYERAVDRDRKSGYAYAARLMARLSQAEVEKEAARFAGEWVAPRLVSDTASLIALCRAAGLRPFVVSASARPIVLAAAPLAGIAAADCRGIETVVRGGAYTDEVVEPVAPRGGAHRGGGGAAARLAALRRSAPPRLACPDAAELEKPARLIPS
jgi:phosphoserine phosphatase